MNIQEIFKNQTDSGATEMWFYGIETPAEKVGDLHHIHIKSHKGTLEIFPTNLEFVRMMDESTPLFREGHREWNEDLLA